VRTAKERNLDLGKVGNSTRQTGKGATGPSRRQDHRARQCELPAVLGIETAALNEQANVSRRRAPPPSNIAIDGKLAGLFAIADP